MMENFLNLTPVQTFFVLLLDAWIIIIFPLIVIRKLNYLTELIESQIQDEPTEGQGS